jgi:hypothetical protein
MSWGNSFLASSGQTYEFRLSLIDRWGIADTTTQSVVLCAFVAKTWNFGII